MALSRATRLRSPSLEESYAYCARLARDHYENFTVVSWMLPRNVRVSLQVIYAFCRYTDDLGDESPGDRLLNLDDWERELDAAYSGTPSHPITVALQDVIRRFNIPKDLFSKLVHANRMDQSAGRFATYDDLLFYCDHSANPVGRIVLHLFGDYTQESHQLSDATCTALQLTNFWQDVKRDLAKGRVYLPLEDIHGFGYSEEKLTAGLADESFRSLMRFEVGRTQALFEDGKKLIDRLHGRHKISISLFNKGGLRVLEAIRAQGYNVLAKRPIITRRQKLWLAITATAKFTILRRL